MQGNTMGHVEGSDVCVRTTCVQARGSVCLDGAARRGGGQWRSQALKPVMSFRLCDVKYMGFNIFSYFFCIIYTCV
jgi:hypothetical protein